MTSPSFYSTGTLSVPNGSTDVTGTGTAWSTALKPYSLIVRESTLLPIGIVADDTIGDAAFTLYPAWGGTDLTDEAYFALTWNDGGDIATAVRTLMERWIGKGAGRVSAGNPLATDYDNSDLIYDRAGNYLAIKDQGVIKVVATVLSAFGTVVFGDVTNSPSDRDEYDDGQGDLSAAPDRLIFFSLTEAGFYVLLTPDTGSGATWSDLVSIKGADGATVTEVLDELGIHSITVSTDPPSGGIDGDMWFQVSA